MLCYNIGHRVYVLYFYITIDTGKPLIPKQVFLFALAHHVLDDRVHACELEDLVCSYLHNSFLHTHKCQPLLLTFTQTRHKYPQQKNSKKQLKKQ